MPELPAIQLLEPMRSVHYLLLLQEGSQASSPHPASPPEEPGSELLVILETSFLWLLLILRQKE